MIALLLFETPRIQYRQNSSQFSHDPMLLLESWIYIPYPDFLTYHIYSLDIERTHRKRYSLEILLVPISRSRHPSWLYLPKELGSAQRNMEHKEINRELSDQLELQ